MATRHIRVYLICLLTVFVSTVASARLWDPLLDAVPNLVALYDASDLSTVTTNTSATSNVLQWDDKSANGYHMKSGGNRPAYGTYTINGLKAINYDGTSDQMATNNIPDIDCTNVCIISVIEPKLAGDYPSGGFIAKTDASDYLESRGQNNDSQGRTSCGLKLDGGTAISMTSVYTTNFVDDVALIMAAWYDGYNGVARVNGGEVSKTTDAADGLTFTINTIQCGRQSNTPRNYHGEMIVLNTADIDTIELVEGYLAWKWGTQDKLPAGHPYKNAAPEVPPDGTLFIFE